MWLSIVEAILPGLLAPLKDIFQSYIAGKISEAELAEKLKEALLVAFSQADVALLDSITKTYTSFWQTNDPIREHGWAVVLYSQLFVLLWHQFVIPFLVTFHFVSEYAQSGTTVNWAYALVALCLGAPAIASRIGPAANWASDGIKRLVTKG